MGRTQKLECERYGDSLDLHDGKNSSLLTKVLETGKQVIISSQKNPKDLKIYKNPNIKWLYVVPNYPCSLKELDFTHLDDFHGYSNHCLDFIVHSNSLTKKLSI